jgi:hypothetical protein
MGLKSSGGGGRGGDPDDECSGKGSEAGGLGDEDEDAGDVGGGDCAGGVAGCGVVGGFDELVVLAALACGAFEFGLFPAFAEGAFGEGTAAGEGFASLDGGFDVEELVAGFCFMAIGPC